MGITREFQIMVLTRVELNLHEYKGQKVSNYFNNYDFIDTDEEGKEIREKFSHDCSLIDEFLKMNKTIIPTGIKESVNQIIKSMAIAIFKFRFGYTIENIIDDTLIDNVEDMLNCLIQYKEVDKMEELIKKVLNDYGVEDDFEPYGEEDMDNIIKNISNEVFGDKAYGWCEEISDGKYDMNIELDNKNINFVNKSWYNIDNFIKNFIKAYEED